MQFYPLYHHGIRAEPSHWTFDFSTHDHHIKASRILTAALSTGFKWKFLFCDLSSTYLKGRLGPRVSTSVTFFWIKRILMFCLFLDTFRIQRILLFCLFLDTLRNQGILLFPCFQTLSVIKRFACFDCSKHLKGRSGPAWVRFLRHQGILMFCLF